MPTSRILYLDVLKLFAIYLVLWGHAIMHFQPDYDSFDDAALGTYNVSGYFTIAQLISRSELMGIVLFGHLKKNVEKDMRE